MNAPQPRTQILAYLLVIVAVAAVIPCVAAQSEKLGFLRIKAEYPIQVPRSYSFSIKLRVEYAFREYFEIQAAIYEGARGAFGHPLWEGMTERLAEVGEEIYEVQLESPPTEGRWMLTGYAFHRNASGSFYFTDPERGPGFVEMNIKVADNARLTLRAPYDNIPVYLDGSSHSTDTNGILVHEFRVFTEHSIAAPANVSIANGWRAIFQSWNGTDARNPMILVITSDLLLTIDFRDEFYLDLVSDVADVRGAGWYRSGAVANFSAPMLAPTESWEDIFGVQRRFAGWSGDVESAAPNESIVMDRPHRVAANWNVDYQRFFYLVIIAAALVAGGLAVFLTRRIRRRPPEPSAAPARTFCMFCGADIDADAKFCSKCGKSQVNSD